MQQDKWNIKKKKGYLKIHIAIDITILKKYTCFKSLGWWESAYDGRKVMPNLIDHILKNNNNIIIKSSALEVMALMIVMKILNIFKRRDKACNKG
jgi:hypothetical protein